MSAAVLIPPLTAPPVPLKFTVEEFDQMGDMGWFEGRRAFLFDGTVREQGPMNPPHAITLGLVNRALTVVFGASWWIRCQAPLHVDEFNNPLPDFAVVPGDPRDYHGRHRTTAALIVEVSDTTLAFDMADKAERYAESGIADYWIVDLVNGRLHVYRDPDPARSRYGQHAEYGSTDRVAPLGAPHASILVADLLP